MLTPGLGFKPLFGILGTSFYIYISGVINIHTLSLLDLYFCNDMYIVYNNKCIVCVCLCVFVPPEISEWKVVLQHFLYHLEELCLASCITAFQAYAMCSSREKAFGILCQLVAEFCACTITLLAPLGRMNLAHYKKAV